MGLCVPVSTWIVQTAVMSYLDVTAVSYYFCSVIAVCHVILNAGRS